MRILKLILFLSIGTVAMLLPILIQSRWMNMKRWKGIAVALSITVAGTIGALLLSYVESQEFGGTSFYGAVFIMPAVMLVVSRLLKETYGQVMDLCAPAAGAMLFIMKINCRISGCCAGRYIYGEVPFPSQIVESINGLILMFVILTMAKKKPGRGDLYPWFLVIYGCTRFVLNLFRGDMIPFLFGMTAGNFWSVISVIWGVLWLLMIRKNQTKE